MGIKRAYIRDIEYTGMLTINMNRGGTGAMGDRGICKAISHIMGENQVLTGICNVLYIYLSKEIKELR